MRRTIAILFIVFSTLHPRAAGADGDAGVATETTRANSAIAPGVVVERPYAVGRRPRPDGLVRASVADEELARWNVGGNGDPAFPSNRSGFHPAPRVKVDTTPRSGRLLEHASNRRALSRDAVLAQTRNHGYWPFRLCFEAGLRRDPKLGGKTLLRVVVARSGRVASSRILSTDLRDRETTTCLASRARALEFSPGPARRFDLDVSIDLNHGDAPLPDSGGATAGDLDADSTKILATLSTTVPAVTGCYAEGTARDPALWGRLGIRVDLRADGTALRVEEIGSRFPDASVVGCVLDVIRRLKFAEPIGGALSFVWGLRLGARPTSAPAVTDLASRSTN